MACAKIRKCTCTLYEQKNPVCIQTLPAYTGIGDAETQSPGMLRKPGDLPYSCPRPKKFKRLATRDILHGSRPYVQQRGPDGRIVPTPSDVSDKGASTKRCARRKKKLTIIRIHARLPFGEEWGIPHGVTQAGMPEGGMTAGVARRGTPHPPKRKVVMRRVVWSRKNGEKHMIDHAAS